MDDQLTINDLPVECVDEILKWITDPFDRIYMRFVCKLWCVLIDQDCSSECYRIDDKAFFNQFAIKSNHPCNGETNLRDKDSPILIFQRKKTSFHFEKINFQGSDLFWRRRGAGIIWLDFGYGCTNIPLKEVIDHCPMLKTLKFKSNKQLNVLLENCIADGKTNYSVRFLYLEYYPSEKVANIARLVSQVFLGACNVFFKDSFSYHNWDRVDLNSFSTAFKNLKFVITMSDSTQTVIFDPLSDNAPVKMTSMEIYANLGDIKGILTHLSRYPGGHNYLNSLTLCYNNVYECYRLDDLQELITECPSLKSLTIVTAAIYGTVKFIQLTKPLSKNNIEDLKLYEQYHIEKHPFTIDDAFLQSFKNLKTFECRVLFFSDFVELLRKLPKLENLKIYKGTIDVNPEEIIISHGQLLKLEMPKLFLHQTIAKFNFPNLRMLYLCEDHTALTHSNVLEYLKHIDSPKLETLDLDFDLSEGFAHRDDFVQWMLNILALFPRLTKFLYMCRFEKNFITDEMLKKILAKFRRLREMGNGCFRHTFTILSPSHFKHRCPHGESDIYVIP